VVITYDGNGEGKYQAMCDFRVLCRCKL